jgi:thiol-disulfide isomerase/thioredoxin
VQEVNWTSFQEILVGQSGHVVVVNVWASWCTPCRAEAPEVARLAEAIAPEAVMVGLVAQDSPANAREFIGEFSLGFPNLLDASGEITDRLQMRGFPTTYVFDSDGRLSTLMFGGVTEQRLAAAIRDAQA